MNYRHLGKSGLRSQNSLRHGTHTQSRCRNAKQLMAVAWIAVSTDNAEGYCQRSVKIMGALRELGLREQYLVSKDFLGGDIPMNGSVQILAEGGDCSLHFVDHVDLIFAHRPTPRLIEETRIQSRHQSRQSYTGHL